MSRSVPRRSFLRGMASAAGAYGALAAWPPAIRRALAIEAHRRTGTLEDVAHIVVLTQENRGFDHYFGTLNGVRGFADPFPVPVRDRPGIARGRSVWVQPTQDGRPAAIAPFHLDTAQDFACLRVRETPHSWSDAQAAWDQGRMDAWPHAKQNHAMGYYRQRDIPFQFALADAFTLCDHYHCSAQAGTNTNRLFLWTGTNDPLGRGNGPATDNSHEVFNPDPRDDYTWTTYPQRLQDAGIAWQVYQDMADNFSNNALAGFRPFRDAWYERPGHGRELKARGITTRPLDLLRADVLAGTLPQVSWIVATAEGSEHPAASSPAQGADYIARVLQALTANPAVWSRTVLFVNFDENDGFFDHMPPPAVPSYTTWDADPARAVLAGGSTVDCTGEHCEILNGADAGTLHRPYGLGPRVPLFVVSPWSKGGWVNSQVADHTSVIRFIEQRFGVREPNISAWRRAVCGDLQSAFNFADPEDSAFFASLPATLARAERSRALRDTRTPPTPTALRAPVQAGGARPARALPYELHTHAAVASGPHVAGARIALEFGNTGTAAAVFHVYDRLDLAALPRRFTVEPGQQWQDSWSPASNGAYDLWVLGPNGFHRHFTGQVSAQARPEVRVLPDRATGTLVVELHNPGSVDCRFRLAPNRYGTPMVHGARVAPGGNARIRLQLQSSAHWYDFSVRVAGQASYSRRFAGHLETGAPSLSDPAMAGQALLAQYQPR